MGNLQNFWELLPGYQGGGRDGNEKGNQQETASSSSSETR